MNLRIRLPAGGNAQQAVAVSAGRKEIVASIPAKEWAITDDVLRVADSASFTVANIDGENTDKFTPGQRIEIDGLDDAVANGQWTRIFTGRVIKVRYGSDISGGSVVAVEAMDLGWHLTSCCARPLQTTNHITLSKLVQELIDPTWGFKGTTVAVVTLGNALNRSLKQGRAGVVRSFAPPKPLLPFIQVEPGQTPWSILEEYFKREGFLLNVGVEGDLIVFQPDYDTPVQYATIEYHGSDEAQRALNNVVGRPSREESLDGIYSEYQCWSTIAVPDKLQTDELAGNPNAQYLHERFAPDENPLPFYRLQVVMDSEAINAQMRRNRAVWGYQMGLFNSTTYEVTVQGHSSRPDPNQPAKFWTSDSMASVNDSVHGVTGSLYIQAAHRSSTIGEGERTKLTLRKPLLDPSLQAQLGGGAKRAAKPTPAAA